MSFCCTIVLFSLNSVPLLATGHQFIPGQAVKGHCPNCCFSSSLRGTSLLFSAIKSNSFSISYTPCKIQDWAEPGGWRFSTWCRFAGSRAVTAGALFWPSCSIWGFRLMDLQQGSTHVAVQRMITAPKDVKLKMFPSASEKTSYWVQAMSPWFQTKLNRRF